MEESEKRRKRLKAMRMESQNPCSSSSSSSQSLSNPLLDKPEETTQSTAPRFGFYTDPMAAFDNTRRTGANSHFAPRPHFPSSPSVTGPKNPEMPVSGVHQFQNSYSPHQNVHQGGDPYYSPGPASSPLGIRSPYPVHQGNPGFSCAPGRGHCFNNSPSPIPGCGGSPYPLQQGSPNFRSPPQGRGYQFNNSPGRPSPSPSMGRGRGQFDASPHSGGRGRGYGFDGRARSFYDKSMVEDPWKSLEPVIWQVQITARINLNSRGSNFNSRGSNLNNRSFIEKTPSAKKPKVSNQVDTSNSKQSLAEFLAESFDEAVGDAAPV